MSKAPHSAALLSAFIALMMGHLQAAEMKLLPSGLEIAAGSLGTFTVSYPELEPAQKVIEVRQAQDRATVRYEGGAECLVAIRGEEMQLEFKARPATLKSWKMAMLIDIAFAKGGTWQIAAEEGSFPAQKATPPHFASLHGTSFALKNAQGQSLSFTTPDFAFQQLTDNRTWDWPVYQWQFIVPHVAERSRATLRITSNLGAVTALIDPFGQSLRDDFPNKLKRLEDLKADVDADADYYRQISPPTVDRFGGQPGSGKALGLKAKGFFHVQKAQDKWWLVDPEGEAFFHLGVCGFAPNDDYTYVKGREGIYQWLPQSEGEYASAFRPGDGGDHFSFYLANVIRKFGQPHDQETHTARMIERVRKWGFNSIGAFSPTPEKAHVTASFPYVAHLPLHEWQGVPRLPGAHEVWDPYDAATQKRVEENMRREVPSHAKDPLLIGWFIINEPRYDELPRVIPSLDGRHACKQQLVAFLRRRHTTLEAFNNAWQMQAKSWEELVPSGLPVTTDAARAEVKAFVAEFLETLLGQVERLYRELDPQHLLLGCRLQPITIEDETLCRILGRHVDVMSYNYYTFGVDTAALKRYHEWSGGKPMMLSEFFWASPKDSGLIGGREVATQQERGLAYRNYVEQSAALGFVIGVEWFTLVDQATTGRWFSRYNGESYNTGLISVADRPWKEMLAEMMKTNHTIYDLLLGRRPAFAWSDPRFQPATKQP